MPTMSNATDLPSGKEFYEAARRELGYNKRLEFVYEDGYTDHPTTLEELEDLSMHASASLDWLSQGIAIDSGQAKEIAPGIVQYRSSNSERFETPAERENDRREFGAMKDYEKYEMELREKFAEQNPNPTAEQSADNYRENTDLVMKFLAEKNFEAITEGKAIKENEPEYFVNREPIYGDMISYGPFLVASEARDCFESTYPEFDGGSVTLTKIESPVPGISPSELRSNALREEYDTGWAIDTNGSWGTMLSKSTTVLGRDVWDVSQDQAGLIYRHKGKQYEPSFLTEIQPPWTDREMIASGGSDGEEIPYAGHLDAPTKDDELVALMFKVAESGAPLTQGAICQELDNQLQMERTENQSQPTQERNTNMNDELLRAGYEAQQARIEELESWIEQAVTRPSMPRELRLQGLELVEAKSPDIRRAVERICPTRVQGLEHSLEIER
jgi:hypothetical protein